MRKAALLSLMLAAVTGVAKAEPQHGLAYPMVDPSVFSQGQVERLSGHFDDWTVVCDQIRKLNQRFCSLRSAVSADSAGRATYLDVSTGDDGRPAALIHLPLAISVAHGATIDLAPPPGAGKNKKAKTKTAERRAPVAMCSARECLAVWTLTPDEVQHLKNGGRYRISLCTLATRTAQFRPSLGNPGCEVKSETLVSGLGFKRALLAAMN